jgi:4-hydroxy-4-methyl-2-oxoglutarate aldolase
MAVPLRPGFRVVRSFDRPARSLIEEVGAFPAALVSDVQGRQYTMSAAVKPVLPERARILGPALTVKARPGDNLLSMKAIELAKPGDVLVISCDGEANLSVWGGVMSVMAVRQGVAGVVADGLVRDLAQIRSTGLTVFATGLTPAAPTKHGPGQINTTISCGGVVVRAGDIILGDEDGVVVVPQEDAAELIERAHKRVELERTWIERIEAGDYSPLVDSDEKLRELGCLVLERASAGGDGAGVAR